MRLVFRVENANGQGPYQLGAGFSERDVMMVSHIDDAHPSPGLDKGIGYDNFTEAHYCACDSLDSLMKWFAGFWDGLAKDNFFVTVWETCKKTSPVGKSGQAIFVKESSKMISCYPASFLTEVYDNLREESECV